MALPFYIVDVFAEHSYAGNPLAVVVDEATLPKETMQKIAAEMNFSETTFIHPVPESNNGYRINIFTPSKEIVFAGHPVLGSAKIIRDYIASKPDLAVTLNLTVGEIPVSFEQQNGNEIAWFRAPPMMFQDTVAHEIIAPTVGLDAQDIDSALPVQVVSAQTAAIIVPLKTLAALQKCRLDLAAFAPLKQQGLPPLMYLYCSQTRFENNDLSARFFFEANGVREDPATGNGAAFLGAYLLKNRVFQKSGFSVRIEQGYEINRPSLVMLRAQLQDDLADINVGGNVIEVIRGELIQ